MSASSSDPIMTQEKHAGNAGVRRLLPGRFDALMLSALNRVVIALPQRRSVRLRVLPSEQESGIGRAVFGWTPRGQPHNLLRLWLLQANSKPWSPNGAVVQFGRRFEAANDRIGIPAWRRRGGTVVWQWPANGPGVTFVLDFGNPTSLAFSPDGGTLAVASGVLASGRVYLWDLERQAGRLVETHSLLDTSLGMSGSGGHVSSQWPAVRRGRGCLDHFTISRWTAMSLPSYQNPVLQTRPSLFRLTARLRSWEEAATLRLGTWTRLRLRYITINGSSQSLFPDGRTLASSRVPSVLLFDLVKA